jgi:hypothetical protein
LATLRFARRALVLTLVAQGTIAMVTAPPVRAAAATTVFTPIADARIQSDQAAANFGSADRLGADNSPRTKSFLRFDVTGLTSAATGARLRLWVTDKSSNGPEVRTVNGPWDEATLTYDGRPPVGSAVIADAGSVPAGRWLEYNVGAVVAGNGVVDLALVGDSSDGTDFASREDADPARRPQLVVASDDAEPPPPPPPPPPGGAFSFGLIGDTGYSSSSVTKFLKVRDAMNAASLDFVVHVGDFKNGTDPCPDSIYATNRDRFDGFKHPLVYTPGDNEWRDCSSKLDRLAHLRQVFFADDTSRGAPSMTVTRQSAAFPENARWQEGALTFVTLHNVGTDNNGGQSSEFEPRNAANIAWMKAAFAAARADNSAAVVIFSHANPGFPPDATSRAAKVGFHSYLDALRSEVKAWGRPVIYVHGDTHTFRVDHPTVLGTALPNFTRVEVYGPSDEHWVRVDYDPANPALFQIRSR